MFHCCCYDPHTFPSNIAFFVFFSMTRFSSHSTTTATIKQVDCMFFESRFHFNEVNRKKNLPKTAVPSHTIWWNNGICACRGRLWLVTIKWTMWRLWMEQNEAICYEWNLVCFSFYFIVAWKLHRYFTRLKPHQNNSQPNLIYSNWIKSAESFFRIQFSQRYALFYWWDFIMDICRARPINCMRNSTNAWEMFVVV